jgi:hypothetical protein
LRDCQEEDVRYRGDTHANDSADDTTRRSSWAEDTGSATVGPYR